MAALWSTRRRGEAFGLFAGDELIGEVVTHEPSVSDMANLVAEAGLEISESHRRSGHGKALLAYWTREMQARGRACLHSTSLANAASIALAKSVGYVEYARTRSAVCRPREAD